jgi:hypothetical protein
MAPVEKVRILICCFKDFFAINESPYVVNQLRKKKSNCVKRKYGNNYGETIIQE